MALKWSLKAGRNFHKTLPPPYFEYKQNCSLPSCYMLIRVSVSLSPPFYRASSNSCNGVLKSSHKTPELINTSSGKNCLSLINHYPPKTAKYSYILHKKSHREKKYWIYLTGRIFNDIPVICSCTVNYWIKPSVSLATVPNEYYNSTMQQTVSVIKSRSHL